MTILKAIQDDSLIGSVRAEMREGTCYIGRLIVHPAFQRRGIASALMRAVEAQYAQAERFELCTGHLSAGNIRLYQRLGYTIFNTVPVTVRLSFVYFEKNTSPR